MDIFVLNSSHSKEFCELCQNFKLKDGVTADDLIQKGGFTNYYKPSLYFQRKLCMKDKYPVTFAITINKKTLKIKNFDLLDECFGQPHFCGKEEYEQCREIMDRLIDKDLFEWRVKI